MPYNVPEHTDIVRSKSYASYSAYAQPQRYSTSPMSSIEPKMQKTKVKPPVQPQDNAFKGGFGPHAAPRDLPWPTNANITAYELLAFFPHCLQSGDLVYRFISNGGTRHVLWVILNVARDLPKEWHANRCGTIMYKAMADAGYEDWTVKVHKKWHEKRKAEWNETIVNITGSRTPSQIRGIKNVEDDMPFRDLATGVRRMPEGDDALDLTRMVQYCVDHPQAGWMYPRDYEKLCNALGGPAPIRIEHSDRSVFNRWEAVVPPAPRVWTSEEIVAATKAMETGPKSKRQRADSMRLSTPTPERQPMEATPTAGFQGRTRTGPRKHARLDEIDVEEQANIPLFEDDAPQTEQYVRKAAEYVAPSGDTGLASTAAIALAFAAEHDVGETDSSSAYAFGGPRHLAPYRMLHEIQQPDDSDSSGWAENLRWAWEQRACFWHAVQTEGWNESPAHMELIAQTRIDRVWASGQLLELLAETEEDEEPVYVAKAVSGGQEAAPHGARLR